MLTIENLHAKVEGKTILKGIDLDVKAGFRRKANDVIDRIESSGNDFFEDVRKGYQQLANEMNEVKILDASQPIELLSQQTKVLVERLF